MRSCGTEATPQKLQVIPAGLCNRHKKQQPYTTNPYSQYNGNLKSTDGQPQCAWCPRHLRRAPPCPTWRPQGREGRFRPTCHRPHVALKGRCGFNCRMKSSPTAQLREGRGVGVAVIAIAEERPPVHEPAYHPWSRTFELLAQLRLSSNI